MRTIRWKWGNSVTTVAMDDAGSGTSAVLLPALSSISTRAKMRPLLDRLVSEFRVSSVDWPGFGDLTPASRLVARDALRFSKLVPERDRAAAAPCSRRGRSRSLLYLASSRQSGRHDRTACSDRADLARSLADNDGWTTCVVRPRSCCHRSLGRRPVALRVNVSRFVVARMAREHVYEDPAWLSGDRLDAKLTVSHASGARHAAVRFVSGRPRPRRKPVRLPRASPKRKRADSR